MAEKFLQQLNQVEELAQGSKWSRLCHSPYKYLHALSFRHFFYPKHKTPKILQTKLFTGQSVTIALPSATDIYLTGGKTHDSEIRLVKFLFQVLKQDSIFMDIGAHYGYFSMLAAELVSQGHVYAFEPTTFSYSIIAKNAKLMSNVSALNLAMSDNNVPIEFYEFDNQYSEYNTSDISQFEGEQWFKEHPPTKVTIGCTTISEFCASQQILPDVIKIDVEGLEDVVLKGAKELFLNAAAKPLIVMEYLAEERNNLSHRNASQFLKLMGFQSYVIETNGQLLSCEDLDEYLKANNIDSENVVFKYPV